MLNIAILGAGRMGHEIAAAAAAAADLEVAATWSRNVAEKMPAPAGDLAAAMGSADVAIDFTLPGAFDEIIAAAIRTETPLVCGVSGLSGEQLEGLDDAAGSIPVLYDRNMSFGIAVLSRLVEQAAASFSERYGVQVHETHHVHKVDAPSGTALKLGEALARGQGRDFADVYHYDPDGAEPAEGQIEFQVQRVGEVPGDHKVVFAGSSEEISLSHSVTDRRVFAEGALQAARWLVTKPPGRYRMSDLLVE